jgi:transposase
VLEFFAALPSCLVGIEACPSAHHWSRRPIRASFPCVGRLWFRGQIAIYQ